MATNLGSTGLTFNTDNMKPASGEQIDALWGQNIADNTSAAYHNYFNPRATVGTYIVGELERVSWINYASGGINLDSYIFTSGKHELYFYKKSMLDTVFGTFNGQSLTGVNGGNEVGTFYLVLDSIGTIYENGVSIPASSTTNYSGAFSYDASGLTDGQMYKLTINSSGFDAQIAGGSHVARGKFGVFCS